MRAHRASWTVSHVAIVLVVALLLPVTACDTDTTTRPVPASTATTLGPGVMRFATLLDRFQILLAREASQALLPFRALPREAAWLFDPSSPVDATEAQAYGFANGDLVILFFVGPTTDQEACAPTLLEAARAKYSQGARIVSTSVDGDFGFVVVSGDYWSELRRLAQWARQAHAAFVYDS